MASIFDGPWRSSIVPSGNDRPDGTFHIEVDAQNRLVNSTHHLENGDIRSISGEVIRGTRFHSILIDEFTPARVRYKGSLTVENGPPFMVSGLQDLDPEGAACDEAAGLTGDARTALFDQLQEVWVATKP